jgi:hypothetical protein
MAFVPAQSLAELLIKACVARPYIERTDDKLPDDPRDRLWLGSPTALSSWRREAQHERRDHQRRQPRGEGTRTFPP